MILTSAISKRNYYAFIWHAAFLAIATNFMDVDTVIPSMLIHAGGTSVHVGILTAILIGGTRLSQILFAPFINQLERKKGALLVGIKLRILALFGMAILFYYYKTINPAFLMMSIFILMTFFSLGGAFASVSYTDIMGKSIFEDLRKQFLSLKQIISSVGVLLSAFLVGLLLRHFDYPVNYFTIFIFAAIFLLISSLGFWSIKEFLPEKSKDTNSQKNIFHAIFFELKTNKRLKHYLMIINTLGLGYGLLPFILLYGKKHIGMTDDYISNLLLAKTFGVILSGLLIYFYSKSVKYDTIMRLTLTLALAFPVIAWIFQDSLIAYYISFFLGGIFLTLFLVINGGIILEISNNHNRAIYAGIAGVGNLLPTLMPFSGGVIINYLGFNIFFGLNILIIFTSLVFINRINCLK